MTREECGTSAGELIRVVSDMEGKLDALYAQSEFTKAAALFAIAEALHAVAEALQPGDK